jgi:hypothetical protein
MTNLRQAAQQALEALKSAAIFVDSFRGQKATQEAITALQTELAQPEQQAEPCIGKDPRCPCQDGDACHYKDCGNTKARPVAQPEQEPVAWAVQGCSKMWRDEFAEIDAKAEAKRIGGTCVAYALYTTPPAAQRPWVGLDEDEILDLFDRNNVYGSKWIEFARTVEAKLKERNT